jgi:GNAT superfamily N-acetyltransferase
MLTIQQVTIEDAADILAVQKLAYQAEAALYNHDPLPPLTETLAELQAAFATHTFLKAVADGQIIGSVRACIADGTCYIGRLLVHPARQNQGIGTRLMAAIEAEARAQGVRRFELFTGHKSARNLYLYHKLGYRPFKQERVNDQVELVYLEKWIGGEG